MDEKDDQIAHHRILAGREIPTNYGRNNNSPATPSDLNRANSFLNLRVADIWACYKQWGEKGACFLTEPLDNHGWEWRCYMRDPDGYLIEVGQYTEMPLDRFKDAS
jgi:hypothetical protein